MGLNGFSDDKVFKETSENNHSTSTDVSFRKTETEALVVEYVKNEVDKKFIQSSKIADELDIEVRRVTYFLRRSEEFEQWSSGPDPVFVNKFFESSK